MKRHQPKRVSSLRHACELLRHRAGTAALTKSCRSKTCRGPGGCKDVVPETVQRTLFEALNDPHKANTAASSGPMRNEISVPVLPNTAC